MCRDQFWILLFAGYFTGHAALRLATGGALGLDESEIFLDARRLDWGYGPQLPLYAWLQWAVFQITGPTLLGLTGLKNVLLFATVATLYATLRTRHSPYAAGLAVLSLLLLPSVSWEAQRALTHSVLVNFASVLTLLAVWQMLREPRAGRFVLLGLAMAVGGLSKYNYALVPAAMILAALTMPDTRRAILSPWLAVSFAFAAVLLARPMLWIAENPDLALASVRKLEMTAEGSTVMIAATGMGALALAALGFVAPLVVVGVGLWAFHRLRDRAPAPDDLSRFIAHTILWALALIILITLASGSTNIKDRWLQPILIFSAPLAILWLLPRIEQAGAQRLLQVSAGLAVLIAVVMVYHNTAGRAYRAAPFAALTPQITAHIPEGGAIVAPVWVAGNLAYQEPEAPIFSAREPEPDRPILRVWKSGKTAPDDVIRGTANAVAAPYRLSQSEQFSLSFAPASP